MDNYPEEYLEEKPYNAADPEQVNALRKKDGRKVKSHREYLKTIMSSQQGRSWMFELLNTCKIFSSPIVAGDVYFTYHNIGEQNIGKYYLQLISEIAPDEYVLMMQESRS